MAGRPVLDTLSVNVPDRVMVKSPMEPDGEPGPGGTVYVMTSTVGVEPPAEGELLAPEPEPGTVIVSSCEDVPLALDPEAVTVGGCEWGVPSAEPGTVTVRG